MTKSLTFSALRQAAKASLLLAGLAAGSYSYAEAGRSHATNASEAVLTPEAKAAYPLTTCVVSGEKLGEMGEPYDYVHKEAGKPDRLVRFCCKMCVKDFKKEPAKYLKKIDDAAAGGGHSESHGHSGH